MTEREYLIKRKEITDELKRVSVEIHKANRHRDRCEFLQQQVELEWHLLGLDEAWKGQCRNST